MNGGVAFANSLPARNLHTGDMTITDEQFKLLGNGDAQRGRRELKLMLLAEKDRTIHSGQVERPASVRIATPNDEQALLDLLIADLRENAEHIAPINPQKVLGTIMLATRGKGGICGVIDDKDGKPIGLVLLVVADWWWSNQHFVQEVVAYVHPDHRHSHAIDDLLTWAKWAVNEFTVQWGYRLYMLCGTLSTRRIREKIMLYRRKFKLTGSTFIYPAPPDPPEETIRG